MPSNTSIALTLAGLLLPVAIAWWIKLGRPALKRARQYINDVSTCGYLAPPPTAGWVRFLQRLAAVLTKIQVGRIVVVGKDNIPQLPNAPDEDAEPFMVCPNHPHYIDPGVIVRILSRPVRFMAARGVFTFAKGLGALLAGPCGAFSTDLTPGKGGPAREAAIKVLTTKQILVMFPEGWAYLDGKMGPLHKGAVRIAKEASRQIGKPIPLIPVHLRYGCYPGSWIKKMPPPLQYFWMYINKWFYRRGVTVVVGEAIDSTDLPADDAQATEMLKARLLELSRSVESID